MFFKLLLLSPVILLGIQAGSVLLVTLYTAGKIAFEASASLRNKARLSRRRKIQQETSVPTAEHNASGKKEFFEPVFPAELYVTPCCADNPSTMSEISMESLEQMKTSDDADIIYDKNVICVAREECDRQEELDTISIHASSF